MKKTSAKRLRRRDKRATVYGPEREILDTNSGQHTLECGHVVDIHATEGAGAKRRRCLQCIKMTGVFE
jgi:hypothetical protein